MPGATKVGGCEDDVTLFRFDFSIFSRLNQFLILGSGVFFFYLIHGILQEDIFKAKGVEPHIWFANFMQFLICSVCGVCELAVKQELRIRRASMSAYSVAAALTVTAFAFGNEACFYLNYPTLVVFKCCKLIPLLIGGILIQRKWYTVWQFIGCGLMTVGLSLFVLADSSVSTGTSVHTRAGNENDLILASGSAAGAKVEQISSEPDQRATVTFSSYPHPKGVLLVTLAVLGDAALTNVQERLMNINHVSCSELVTYTYAMGASIIAVRCVFETGFSGFYTSWNFFLAEPHRFDKLLMYGVVSYFGLMCFALLIRTSGSLIAVMVNTCRRGVTVVLSFVLYSKPFTFIYLFAGMIVLSGITMNLREEERIKQLDRSEKAKENKDVNVLELKSAELTVTDV